MFAMSMRSLKKFVETAFMKTLKDWNMITTANLPLRSY